MRGMKYAAIQLVLFSFSKKHDISQILVVGCVKPFFVEFGIPGYLSYPGQNPQMKVALVVRACNYENNMGKFIVGENDSGLCPD